MGEVEPLAAGVAVAEEPQANNRATNSRTIALGRCLVNDNLGLDLDIGTAPSPFVTNNTYELFDNMNRLLFRYLIHIFTLMFYRL